MARVVLVQPPHRDTFGYSMPPLGPLHLGAAARSHGHDPVFLDFALLARRDEVPVGDELIEACAGRVLAQEPDAVGLSAMISSMPAALDLAAALHERQPALPIILGGQGPETVEEKVIARHTAVAAVAVGEADVTFPQWLDVLDEPGAWASVAGLVIRRDGRPFRTPKRRLLNPLDEAESPAWDLAESPRAYAAASGETEALFPIDLGRGCTYACSFCTTPVFWGRAARHLSATRAVDELDRLAALDGVGCAYVTHDLFTFDRRRVLEICAEKRRRGNELPWECRTRMDLVDDELLEAMAEAGCRRILYGVESDSAAVLDRVNKGGIDIDARDGVRRAASRGIDSIVGVMVGVPGERPEDVEANLQLMADVGSVDGTSLSLHWFNVTPGNDRRQEVESVGGRTELVPGVSADLVRGFDLPAGRVTARQRAMIRDDPEIFGAFRVFVPEGWTARSLYRLTRNAHLILEVLPRTAKLMAHRTGAPLTQVLRGFFDELSPADDVWDEPDVLRRDEAVASFAAHAAAAGHGDVAALARYEEALFTTTTRTLLRFGVDPAPLVRALDGGHWPAAADEAETAVAFTRRGDRVTAHVLSPFLADVAEGHSTDVLRQRWPECDDHLLDEARARLAEFTP